jgi:hypothetical protein
MRGFSACAVLFALSSAHGASAQTSPSAPVRTAQADREYAAGHFDEAAVRYEAAVASGGLEPAELIRAHERLGLVSVLRGESESAENHFRMVLALDPTRATPAELPEEWRARYAAIRAAREGRRITLVLERDGGSFVLTARDAPADSAYTIQVRGRGGWVHRAPVEEEPLRIEPPPDALPLAAVLLDANGNRLARAGVRPIAASSIEPVRPEPAHGRSLLESPWLWIAVALVIIGVGVGIGVSASGDRYLLGAPVIR